ncbi:hypothetical protein CPB83DRAFT_783294 [Crepidotus variabilis]|uniref:Senescence domain-containing protein n=1 Tax=Crepidotus variabilis TaxID=179855 RepID=A0A9P6ERA4_9AGAR|nr:hypothetical protein CPB83DRAFT_783294 [Crepidotus variabilis]
MHTTPEAFLLLSLPKTSLTVGGRTENGTLDLEFVSMPVPDAPKSQDREVYLVLRLNSTEIALDPARVVKRADMPEFRTYTLAGTSFDPAELIIRVMAPRNPQASDQEHVEKLSTFENILEQYVEEFNGPAPPMPHPQVTPASSGLKGGMGAANGNHDLRGQLVMINEDTGEVIGEVERNFKIKEDPLMNSKGHEDDPVIIEVPEGTANQQTGTALEAFARIVPPDQQNWITKGASVMSHAISMTTSLLVTTITTASDHYVKNSTASPHHSGAATPLASGSRSPMGGPPPLPPRAPPRALVFLTSERTRKGMSTVHTMSGEAVKISGKTVNAIDGMIRRAMGAKPKRTKLLGQPGPNTMAPPPVPARAPSPGGNSGFAPPPYNGTDEKGASYFPYPSYSRGPPRQPSPVPPTSATSPPPLPPRFTNKEKILISAELILSTLDDSMHKLIDSSSSSITNVMGHKYGPEAAESSRLMTGMAKNVGLVYVDVRGIGRRALLRRAGKTFVKARLSSNNPQAHPVAAPHQ